MSTAHTRETTLLHPKKMVNIYLVSWMKEVRSLSNLSRKERSLLFDKATRINASNTRPSLFLSSCSPPGSLGVLMSILLNFDIVSDRWEWGLWAEEWDVGV